MDLINFTLVGEIITFAVLVWFTMKYVWPPIINAINERQKKIAQGLEAGERGHLNLELSKQQAVRIIQQAKQEAGTIVEHANLQVVEIIDQGKAKAQAEGERLLTLARSDIDKEKEAARQALREQALSLAMIAAEKILRTKIDKQTNQQLIEQLLTEIHSD